MGAAQVQAQICSAQLLTFVDVNVLPQCLVLLQVLQEVLVLSEDRKAKSSKLFNLKQEKIFTGSENISHDCSTERQGD